MSARKAQKPTDYVQLGSFRMHEKLRQQLASEAKKNRVSLNKEMNDRLEQSFRTGAIRSIEDLASSLAKRYRKLAA